MPWFSSNFLGITRTTTLTCQRSQVGEAATLVPCDIRRDELTRHAHCLIAPTGRTRRDPDHPVTDSRRGVAESPSADNANDRNRLAVYVRLPWRSWSVSQGPDCCA